MALCRWKEDFHIDAPNATDQKIRSGEGQCLNGGPEGAFFEKCQEGEPLQKWEFVPAEVTAEKLTTPDGADSVSGQIVLASEDANTNRPKMCLKGTYAGAEGTRVTTVQCDSVLSWQTTWTYAPPPPANKVLLVMPARHAVGAKACVQMNNGYPQLGDCGDEDLVANWWVRDGDLIRMAADGGWCLMLAGDHVGLDECGLYLDYASWSLGEDGSLKLTRKPDKGCFTYLGSEGVYPFCMQPCTGNDTQIFAFVSDAPATDAAQVA